MIDPRYANAGYGAAQQMPMQYHYHHHRHHGNHKHKNRHDESPISRDESIHKVDHGQAHNYQQNGGAPFGTGYGVPYNAGAYGTQYQGDSFGQGHSGVQTVKHRRRHHRHNRHHTVEAGNTGGDRGQGVPEQLIGQRSSSVLSNQEHSVRSPAPAAEGDFGGEHHHRRSSRGRYQRSENASFKQAYQSYQAQGQSRVGADGYGHINEDLIFIERGEHSPHRQEPPVGYEYKGKIEVQGVEKERSRSHGQEVLPQPCVTTYPTVQPTQPPPPVSSSSCPPGWQQVVLQATGGPPCASGGVPYTGQVVGGAGSTAGYSGYGGSYPATSGYQYSSDYTSGYQQSGYQQTSGSGYNPCFSIGGYTGQYRKEHVSDQPGRPTIIEVWQKRQKYEGPRTEPGPSFDFEKFRNEILAAIGRIPRAEGGRENQTQTQIQPITKESEVRVIVQPIQPVFYMPRQSEGTATVVGPAPPASAPNVVYVPRNVYVPVIKPVFVPRERVIVRPQVVHVARPVLVDRPVPVTQRPIIIDRERPIPVPVRGQAAQGGSRIVKEEFVYRDNLPVAYGGRCAEFTGGSNLGYVRQEQHQTQQIQTGGRIEVLDAAVNPNWVRTDEPSLGRRYGPPAVDIVHRSEQVEQQMYSEIRHRTSSGGGGVARSASSASYGSGSGIDVSGGNYAQF